MYGLETIQKMNQLSAKAKAKSNARAWNKQNRPEDHRRELSRDVVPDGYALLVNRQIIRKGDLFWSLMRKKWVPASMVGELSCCGLYARKKNNLTVSMV